MISFGSYGQSFSKKQIKKTEWFSDNKDSVFFKRDTIKLIKYTQKSQQQFNKYDIQFDEREYDYLGHLEYVTLGFMKARNFSFTQKNWSLGIGYAEGLLFWSYDDKNCILSIYKRKNLIHRFKVLNWNEIDITSNKNKNEKIKSIELTLLRL